MMTAPAARSLRATPEPLGGFAPISASDPAVVCILSAVAMLSLMSTGMPKSGPRLPFALSIASAMAMRIRIDFDDAIEGWAIAIDGLDAIEIGLGQFDRGELPIRQPLGQVRQIAFVEFKRFDLRGGS